MDIDTLNTFVKIFVIHLFHYFISLKITKYQNSTKIKTMIIIVISGIVSVIYMKVKYELNDTISFLIPYISGAICFAVLTKNKVGYSMLVTVISLGINYSLYFMALIVAFIPTTVFKIGSNIIHLVIIMMIYAIFLLLFFRIKRVKNGFSFLQNKSKNDDIDIFILSASTIIMSIYFRFSVYEISTIKYVFMELILFTILMVMIIQKTMIMYYKQKLLESTMKQHEKEIEEKNVQINQLTKENLNCIKTNHQFYHRQEALELKIKELLKTNTKEEKEINILNQINALSKEYSEVMGNENYEPKLKTTEIEGIDDMFRYMQLECQKHHIIFHLQVNGNIHYMINHIIPQNKLETLIGDHIRDAIIAIQSGNNENKSIMAMLGTKDSYYEFAVYDSGIAFEIDTLLKLGKEPATTHKNSGGSGMGFMTTFETLKECEASLIIEENMENDKGYTKVVRIRFDKKNEYSIYSYRAEEMKVRTKDNRIQIIKKELNHLGEAK